MKQIRMPTGSCRYSRIAGLIIALGLACQSLPPAVQAEGLGPDILYVGDESDNTIKSFEAASLKAGASLDGANGAFVTRNSGGLRGPMGLLIAGTSLIVVNQDVGQPVNGEISQYQLDNGSFGGKWVSKNDPNAPFAPRGAVLKNGVLYVANFIEDDAGTPGEVLAFAGNGKFLGALAPPSNTQIQFRPRGIVVGPDDLLYVSSDPNFIPGTGPTTGGQVLRFDPNTLGAVGKVFIDDPGGIGKLNRPEGLVFGPDGNLYVTSFCAAPSTPNPSTCPTAPDADTIRIYNGSTGNFIGAIDLDAFATKVGQTRATAQALLFGPSGKLFVPITLRPALVGQVLGCDINKKDCTGFTGLGTLGVPFYLTFGRTDPATLAYPDE